MRSSRRSAPRACAYSTMLGGSGNDFANGIAATADGSTYVTGKIAGLVTLSAYEEAKSERQRAFDLFESYSTQFGVHRKPGTETT